MIAANNYQPGDRNRSEIDPDSLIKGVEDIITDSEARERLYDFLARYVRKVCPDSLIQKYMRAMPGYTFLDLIRPSDVAYVISLLKNGRGMWDMEIEMREMARSGEMKSDAKARPLFTGGKGKKKELGKNLWTKEGIKYYNTGEKNWRNVYKDETFMRVLYGGWQRWLNSHGKLYRVGDDSSKTFYQVMATWFDDSNTKVGGMSDEEESADDDDDIDYESGHGYASDTGVFTHAKKFRDKRVEEHKSIRTVPGPLKEDDTGGEESGEEDKVVKKGAVGKGAVEAVGKGAVEKGNESGEEDKAVKKGALGKGAVEKGNDNSDGNQKKAKEKKGGGISASVKSPTKKAKRKGESSVEEFSPSRNTRQSKGAVINKKTKK